MKTQNPAIRGFSLIELLAVLALAGMATAWLLPGLPGLLQSQARRSALEQVLASLNLARSIALSQGRPMLWAVAPIGEGWPADYALRAFAVFRGEQTAPGTDPTWIQETAWLRLPEGIVFDPAIPDSLCASGWTSPCPITGRPLKIHGLQFQPEGSVDIDSDTAFVRLNASNQRRRSAWTHSSDTIQIRPSTGMARLMPH
jgi:prepilin-type N-terminal cleavage/methylation domain-containing protein